MSISGGKKNQQSHLFVVKGENFLKKTEVVGFDALLPEQKQLIREYEILADIKGKCVGALITGRLWDIRPLHFENGIIKITRFSDPAEKFHLQGYNTLHTLLIRLASALPNQTMLSHGAEDGQIWVTRRFYNTTLSEAKNQFSSLSRQEQLKKAVSIISPFKQIHSEGIFHGHVNLSNLAFDNDQITLLDYGFMASDLYNAHCSDVAPEIKNGGLAGCATDIYGLGMVLATLFESLKMPDEIAIIEKMVQENPALRPNIKQVYEIFAQKIEVLPQQSMAPIKDDKIINTKEISHQAISTSALFQESQPILKEKEDPEKRKQEGKKSPVKKEEAIVMSQVKTPNKHGQKVEALLSNLDHFKDIALALGKNIYQVRPRTVPATAFFSIFILAAFYLVFFNNRPGDAESSVLNEDVMSYGQMWSSNQPSLMRKVALASVLQKDVAAQSVIVFDVLKGNSPIKVHKNLIKAVFDPRWEGELSMDDRLIGLRLGLAGLIPEEAGALPKLSNAHPGVVFALMSSMNLAGTVSQFEGLDIENMFQLPSPLGESFREFHKAGILDINDPSVRAYAHLAMNDVNLDYVENFFGKADDDLQVFKKLRLIIPTLDDNQELQNNVYTFLLTNSKLFAAMYRWFEDEPLASWDMISKSEKMRIIAGMPTKKELSFEQYTDLLKYANPKVRNQMADLISRKFYNGRMKETLTFMSSKDNHLTRSQTIAILAAFPLKGQEASSFFAKWFGQSPDPESVLALLVKRSDIQKDDAFNFEAASYLSRKDWNADLDTLKRLVAHPETLARALAYSKLDKNNPAELQLLRNMVVADPNSKLRDFINQRLQ